MPYVDRDKDNYITGCYKWPQREGQEFVNDEDVKRQKRPPSKEEMISKEMPTADEQLKMIYNLGIDGWKAEIKKIYDKHI